MKDASSFSLASPGLGGLLAVAVAAAAWGGCGGGDGPSDVEWNSTNLAGPLPLSLTNLGALETFHFYDTSLCVPNNASVTAWLQNIDDVRGTNRTCP